MNEQDSVFDGGWKIDTDANTLIAYLWEQAERPEVREAVGRAIHQTTPWRDQPYTGGVWEDEAKAATTTLLTALIGPRPTEQESHDDHE